jgi:predicted transcriptional regulator
MNEMQMGPIESRFADMIWQNAPVTAAALARLAASELGWKKTTCYTVLKRLCDKGIFINEGGSVTPLITRKEYYAAQSRRFVDDSFAGSLPAFIAAFTSGRSLSDEEADALRELLDGRRE